MHGGDSEQESPPFAFYGEECETVEWWYGIGGPMGLSKERQAVAGRPRRTGAKKKAVGRGKAKMNAAAGKTLEEHSEKIANSLLNSTLGGNASSARLLFSLAEGQVDCEDEVAMQGLRSLAEELASEPQWAAEVTEAFAETGFGQREPKG